MIATGSIIRYGQVNTDVRKEEMALYLRNHLLDPPENHEGEEDGDLGHGRREHVRRVADLDAEALAQRDVDVVIPRIKE